MKQTCRDGRQVRNLCREAKDYGVGWTMELHLPGDRGSLAGRRGVDVGGGTLSLGPLRAQESLGFCNPAPVGGLNCA